MEQIKIIQDSVIDLTPQEVEALINIANSF